jgi:hypothetical protein
MYCLVGVDITNSMGYYLYNFDTNKVDLYPKIKAYTICEAGEIINAHLIGAKSGIGVYDANLCDIPRYVNNTCQNKALTVLGLYDSDNILLCDSAFNIYKKSLKDATSWLNTYRCWNKSIIDKNVSNFGLYKNAGQAEREVREYCTSRLKGLADRYSVLMADAKEDDEEALAMNTSISITGVYKIYTKIHEMHPEVDIALTSDFKCFVGTYEVNEGLSDYSNRKNAVAVKLSGMKILGAGAFTNSYVKEISCNVDMLADRVFEGAENLRNVRFEEGVHLLGVSEFVGCSLDTLHLPKSLKDIKVIRTFTGIKGLKTVEVPVGFKWRKTFDKDIKSLNLGTNIVEY